MTDRSVSGAQPGTPHDKAVSQMEAGRGLDALVAKNVFGFKCQPIRVIPTDNILGGYDDIGIKDGPIVPHYSSDIAAAWLVVEKMSLVVIPPRGGEHHPATAWSAGRLDPVGYWTEDILDGRLLAYAEAPTAPLAICRAALLASGVR